MIKNDRQYEISKEWVKKFSEAIARVDEDKATKRSDPVGWQLNRDSLQVHLDGLLEEIAEYEMLVNRDERTPIELSCDRLVNFPRLLIKARLAANLSQKELAELAGLTEEQIRAFEENDYQNASFAEAIETGSALELKLKSCEVLFPLDTLRRTPITLEELQHPRRVKF
ncbi:MAG: helix-turn-helix transcriptional regulator [Oscillatoria sp. SIO1A7]|nr:helix-turn-helix transcriptional regulator [Oscillatoria sp. SIO1A7]